MRRCVFTIWMLAWAAVASAAGRMETRTWTVDGVKREALVYWPDGDGVAPLVFAFHGHGGTARSAERNFGFERAWPEAIVVYPQGLPTKSHYDPAGGEPGWQNTPGVSGDRDLKFFDAMRATLKAEGRVDAARVYATGHSNGGGFTYLLWAERGDGLAAVAPSSAGAGRNLWKLKPKPVLHLAGRADEIVPFANQERTMRVLRRIDGCEAEGKPWASAGRLTGTIYASAGGTPVVTLLHGGGHTFPDEAAGLIVRFFKEHPAAP